jgi:hypothetical protein
VDDAEATGISFTDSELELVRTALRLLLDTLGHGEAEEIDAVQALLARIDGRVA